MELYKKVLFNINFVLLVCALCIAQPELSTSSVELQPPDVPESTIAEAALDQTETVITNPPPLSNSYTPSDIFPSDETKYNITTNATLINQLLKLHENSSEVDDLVNGGVFSNLQLTTVEHIDAENTDEIENTYESENNDVTQLDEKIESVEIPKSETEWIDSGRDEEVGVPVEIINETVNSSTVNYVQRNDFVGIFAGFFIIIAVMAYLGVVAWRRILRNRYGHREMLIDEDEFYDPRDMKHFSI